MLLCFIEAVCRDAAVVRYKFQQGRRTECREVVVYSDVWGVKPIFLTSLTGGHLLAILLQLEFTMWIRFIRLACPSVTG